MFKELRKDMEKIMKTMYKQNGNISKETENLKKTGAEKYNK